MVKNYLPNIPIVVPGSKYLLIEGNVPDTKGEKKTLQTNLFQEDDKEEISYHEKMKFYEKLKNLTAH